MDTEGFVDMRPNRGAVVTSLSPDDVQELFEMLVEMVIRNHVLSAGKGMIEYLRNSAALAAVASGSKPVECGETYL
jgi:hypothetical protein